MSESWINRLWSLVLVSIFAIVALFFMSGCTTTTGMIPVGKDTYSVVIEGNAFTKPSSLKARAFRDANTFCESKGKVMVPVSTQLLPITPFSWGGYDLTFRALDPTDPEVQRPNLQPVPNVQVEVRNK